MILTVFKIFLERSEGEAENIDRTSTLSFSRTMSNLRSKIFSSNKNLFSSQTIKPVQTEDKVDPISMSKPEIVITPSPVNSIQLSQSHSGTKQLTISNLKVNDNAANSEEDRISQTNNSGSNSSNNLNVSMNRSPALVSSFTVQTSPSNGEISQQPQKQQNLPEAEKKTPIFSLSIGKSKKSKSKSPKKKKV